MATETALVPLEEYLRTTYHPDMDWVDGELKERVLGNNLHAVTLRLVALTLRSKLEGSHMRVLTEPRLMTSDSCVRVPDICVVRDDAVAKVIAEAPVFCVEVLSPEDRASDFIGRLDEYRKIGAVSTWIVDPTRKALSQMNRDGGFTIREEVLVVPGTEMKVEAKDIFD